MNVGTDEKVSMIATNSDLMDGRYVLCMVWIHKKIVENWPKYIFRIIQIWMK